MSGERVCGVGEIHSRRGFFAQSQHNPKKETRDGARIGVWPRLGRRWTGQGVRMGATTEYGFLDVNHKEWWGCSSEKHLKRGSGMGHKGQALLHGECDKGTEVKNKYERDKFSWRRGPHEGGV